MSNAKDLEIRISAQTEDGITLGLIEYLPAGSDKAAVDKRVDVLTEVVTRQRAKAVLAGEIANLGRDEAQLVAQLAHRDEQTTKNEAEAKGRSGGKATSAGQLALQNVETQVKNLTERIESRKKGIESLKKLAE